MHVKLQVSTIKYRVLSVINLKKIKKREFALLKEDHTLQRAN